MSQYEILYSYDDKKTKKLSFEKMKQMDLIKFDIIRVPLL
jgi:hypothetical protein